MLERFTVDSIADEIESRVKGAQPTAKMTRRFYKKGKRDGRRQLACEPIAAYLSEAVGIATSKIGQEHLDAAMVLKRQAVSVGATVAELTSSVARGEASLEAGEATTAQPQPETTAPGTTTLKGAENLQGAIGQLRLKRAAAKQAHLEAGLGADREALDRARAQLEATEKELNELPLTFRQLITSCHRTGRFLWARYCSGYEIGKARRGTPDDEEKGPQVNAIQFDYPEALEHHIEEIVRERTDATAVDQGLDSTGVDTESTPVEI